MGLTMAGYSGTPLAKKLGIKAGHRLVLLGAPDGLDDALAPLPDDVRVGRRLQGKANVVVLFTPWREELERRFDDVVKAIEPDGSFWVGWPKKASKQPTDITEDTVRDVALPRGLVDNKVCAIDEVWSGLRLVIRLENRAKN